jgi:uncharacterized membrane protein
VVLGFWLERRFTWAAWVGASLLVIALGALLSNLDLVPARSPVYDMVGGPVTSLAIVWLLLAVDLAALKTAGPRMLGAFSLAVAATAVGALAAAALLGAAVGPDAWKLAGVMTGTYSGGSLNFVSVGRALALPDSLFAAATASDNVMTAVWMGATLVLPLWLAPLYPPPPAEPEAHPEADGGEPKPSILAPVPLRILDVSALVALGLGLLLAAETAAAHLPGVAVIWLTTFTLIVAQIPAVRRLKGALHLGSLALNFFFVIIGIGSRVAEILTVGVEIFWFTLIVVAVHGVLVFLAGRLVRLDALTISIASQAAVGGPSTAMALAVARGRQDLALPGVLVGLLGYAAGTYLGLVVASGVRIWLLGP